MAMQGSWGQLCPRTRKIINNRGEINWVPYGNVSHNAGGGHGPRRIVSVFLSQILSHWRALSSPLVVLPRLLV
jgi:hypothetical protein